MLLKSTILLLEGRVHMNMPCSTSHNYTHLLLIKFTWKIEWECLFNLLDGNDSIVEHL